MAAVEAEDTPKKGPSLVIQIALFVVLTLVALGSGWFAGQFLGGGDTPKQPTVKEKDAAREAQSYDAQPGSEMEAEKLNIFRLETVTTNLAAPSDTWVRIELALVFAGPPDPQMAEVIHQDILAYLRTVKLHQIEGASGFRHLKSDIEERAKIRSNGAVTGVLIRTLLFE